MELSDPWLSIMGGCLLPNLSTPWPLPYTKAQQNLSPKKHHFLEHVMTHERCVKRF